MTRPAPAAAVPLVLVPALGLSQGGFVPSAWVWAGALTAWAAALAVVLGDDAGALRAAWPWLAGMGALLAWTIASALWSVDAAQSVLEARRTLVYAAVVLALVALARRHGSGALVLATHAAITFVVLYALARYLLAGHRTSFEAHQLSDPLGYANAVGIFAVIGILLALGVASNGTQIPRAAAAASLPLLALALELSGSTASWLALVLGVATWVVLEPEPGRLVRTTGVVAAPSAGIVVLAHESGLSTLDTPRVSGWIVACAGAGCALVSAALAVRFAGPSRHAWRPSSIVLVGGVLVALGLVSAAVVVHGAARKPRSLYYHVAWRHEYLQHPVLGSGAGTFGAFWDRFGAVATWGGALDAHSLYLETLAELGPVGLALVLAALLYPLRAIVAARRDPHVPAAGAAYVAFLFHAGLDWDWEMPVVVVAALACAAAAISATLVGPSRLGTRTRVGVLATSLALGAFAIAGARSHTEPAAAPQTRGAPRERGPSNSRRAGRDYLP